MKKIVATVIVLFLNCIVLSFDILMLLTSLVWGVFMIPLVVFIGGIDQITGIIKWATENTNVVKLRDPLETEIVKAKWLAKYYETSS